MDAMAATAILLHTCATCGNVQHRWQDRYCVSCWSPDLQQTPAGPEATLLSWATYHTDYRLDGFRPPYTVGLVAFDGGPRVSCLLVGDLGQARYQARVPVRGASDVAAAARAAGTELTALVLTTEPPEEETLA